MAAREGQMRVDAIPRSGTWTAWNNMQSGPSCEEEPALPGLLALIRPLEKVACDFFK